MSISSTTRKAGPYTCNGSQTQFPFSFKVFSTADVLVVQTDLLSVETTKALTTDYTVSLNSNQDSNPCGTVTMNSAPTSGYLITLGSQVSNTQGVTLTNSGGFYPTVINDALDRATIQVQQLSEKVDRSVKVGFSSSTTPDQLIASIQTSESNAAASASSASTSAGTATTQAGIATTQAGNAAASATSAANSASSIGNVNGLVKGNGAGAVSAATAGTDYAKPNTASTWSAPQKGALTTDNDLSFSLGVTNYFKCTPTAGGTLTFTSIPADAMPVAVLLVNASNYPIAAHANTKISTADLTKISATGTYLLSGMSDGTNVYLVASASLP